MEFEGAPKRSLVSRVKERLQKAFGKKLQPAVPEGADSEAQKRRSSVGVLREIESDILDKVVLEQALRKLSADQQDAFRLVYLEGKIPEEAAQELGIKRKALYERLRKARKKLHEYTQPR